MDAKPDKPTAQDVKKLRDQGKKIEEIMEATGRSRRWVFNQLKTLGMTREQVSHKDWLPWTISDDHTRSAIAQHVRILSSVVQGRPETKERVNSALSWAVTCLASGEDYAYDPSNGLYVTKADPKNYILERLYKSVMEVMPKGE
ncbi:hypothetical protein [Streptomyces sp. NPDC127112]|uniref:hypothetical protein n=1 Tax=Streptomyces sp. NPDC127112 TaxID=3345364 RepID=UPI0036293465